MKKFIVEAGQMYSIEDIPESHRDILMACHHRGACDKDVEAAEPSFGIDKPDALAAWLSEYGAWTDEELQDQAANIRRMLWLMAGAISESGHVYIGI